MTRYSHPDGYSADPESGVVYGIRGNPITHRDWKGYIVINNPRKRYWKMAHRLLWEAVVGAIPSGLQINHKNGVKHDNRLVNLELVTPSENSLHAYRTGLSTRAGEANTSAKLTWGNVEQIRASTESNKALALRFGVGTEAIRRARNHTNWVKKP